MSNLVIHQNGAAVDAECRLFQLTVAFPPRPSLADAPQVELGGGVRGRLVQIALTARPAPTITRGDEISDRDYRIKPMGSLTLRATAKQPFVPQWLSISNEGTENGAADWLVNDIRIDGTSWFLQMGDIPGDLFHHTTVVDSFLRSLDGGTEAEIDVTYIGLEEAGAPFLAALMTAPAERAPEAA